MTSQGSYVEIVELPGRVGDTVTVAGWVETLRGHGKVAFAIVRDGTGIVQCVLVRAELDPEVWDRATELTQETAVAVRGVVKPDSRSPAGVELGVTSIEVLGASEAYPIQPKEHGIEFLMDHRHLWIRSTQQRAVLRVRSEVMQAIHDFFYAEGFTRIDSPILTGSIGE